VAGELRALLAPKFAPWQLPDAFEFIEAVPRTSTGKFWKSRLRERFAGWQWPVDEETARGGSAD
jgi:fatty-acyl-CoA synthase